jgi:hypothetical protein
VSFRDMAMATATAMTIHTLETVQRLPAMRVQSLRVGSPGFTAKSLTVAQVGESESRRRGSERSSRPPRHAERAARLYEEDVARRTALEG